MAKAVDKLAAVTAVPEPANVQYNVDLSMWTYSFQGKTIFTFKLGDRVTDLRLNLDTTQASTVEIDLEDADFTLLDDPLFANWAFDVQDVSLSSAKKFKPTRLTNSTSTAYLGDSADLEWVLGQKPIDFEIGAVAFRLCGIQTQQTTVTLPFEDRTASFLRDQKGHKSWDRSQHTRAEFVAMLCREAGVDYWIPELKVAQPVETATSSSSTTQDPVNPNGKGLARTASLTIFNLPMTDAQKNVANILLGECHRLNAPLVCWQAILYAGIGETKLGATASTYANNSAGATGVLQGTNAHWDINPHDTAGQADSFLQGGFGFASSLALAKSGITDMAEIAVKTEEPSIWPSNAYAQEAGWNDQQVRNEVDKIIAAYGGPALSDTGVSTTGSYAFTRGTNETSWDCIQRLASEVAWYAFVRQNRLWFVSGNYLFSQVPQMVIQAGKNGVDYIDLDLDLGARDQIAECTVTARAHLWSALPGMVVEVLKRGPATGKWFVSALTSHPLDISQGVQITLQKPVPKRAEPAAAASNIQAGQRPTSGITLSGSTRQKIVQAAQQALANRSAYSYAQVRPIPFGNTAPIDTDCSGFIIRCYKFAGAPDPSGNNFDGAGNSDSFVTHCVRTNTPQPGDIVVWPDHAAVYIGSGKIIEFGSNPIVQSTVAAENAIQVQIGHGQMIGYFQCPNLQ